MNIDWDALGSSGISGWDILIAALIAIAGFVAAIFARRGVLALAKRTPGINDNVANFAARFTQYAIILLGIGIGLGFLGASIQPLLAIALIVAVVLVLVLRGVANNFAAGVLLQTRQPIKIGDEIEFDGHVGTVVELNSRSVVIHTLDGQTVHVPNAKLLEEPIINHSDRGARRSEVRVRVADVAGDTADDILTALASAAASAEGVHKREPVRALAVALSPGRLTVAVQFWHHPQHGQVVTSAVVLALSAVLQQRELAATVTSEHSDPPLVPPDVL